MKINLPLNYQLRLYLSRLEKREGVCSKVYQEKDSHIVLWDFDNISLPKIVKSLTKKQLQYKLPNIYIVTSSPNCFHAYCFASRSFREVIHILSDTPEIDTEYLRLGMIRGYYTLRISPRKSDKFKTVRVLTSVVSKEVNPLDVSINEYMTTNKGVHNA